MILVLSANFSSKTAILKCIHVLVLQIYSAADPTPSHLFTSPTQGPALLWLMAQLTSVQLLSLNYEIEIKIHLSPEWQFRFSQ